MARVQSNTYGSASAATSHTANFASTPTQGNTLICYASAGSLVSMSSSGWTADPEGYVGGNADIRAFYKVAGAAESTNVQVGLSTSNNCQIWVEERDDLDTANLFDQSASNVAGGAHSTQPSGTTAATDTADEYCTAGFVQAGQLRDHSSYSNSYVEDAQVDGAGGDTGRMSVASLAVTATGAQSTTLTFAANVSNNSSTGMILTFRVASGGTTVNGTGLGAFTFAGAASGTPETFGTAAGAYTFGGTAGGNPDVQGQAAGAFSFTGAASGSTQATVNGTGEGAYSFTATATGAPETFGTAEASLSFAGAASGVPDVQGSAAASVTFSAAASGNPDVQGQAAATLTFTGTASGEVEGVASGTGLGDYTFTGAAAGTPDVHGVAAGPYAFTGDATGVRARLGQAVATLTFNGTALGAPRLSGQAVGALVFAGAASGTGSGDVIPDPNPHRLTHQEHAAATYREPAAITYREVP